MENIGYYALQKAIYEKLVGNVSLMAVIVGVFDHTPQETAFPFVTIGDVAASDYSSLGKSGTEQRLNIHIWSREAGHKQVADIMEMIYGLLHNGSVTVVGQTLVAMRFLSTSIQLEGDGWTNHGVMRLLVHLIDS